jgi:hypothetical protein
MTASVTAQISSDGRLTARSESDALLLRAKEQDRPWTLDDDCGCRQRNSPASPDWHLIQAVVDLEN